LSVRFGRSRLRGAPRRVNERTDHVRTDTVRRATQVVPRTHKGVLKLVVKT